MLIAFISLLFGLIIGYMAQRSRMCFIGGIRDFVLVRDTELLKGFFSFLATAAVLFYIVNALGGDTPGYPWYEREKARASLELAREIFVYAACWIPDDVLLVLKENAAKAAGFTLPGGMVLSYTAAWAIAGGAGIGWLSTLANGCPLRQHVLAASGNKSAFAYLAGFYIGAIIYTLYIGPLLAK